MAGSARRQARTRPRRAWADFFGDVAGAPWQRRQRACDVRLRQSTLGMHQPDRPDGPGRQRATAGGRPQHPARNFLKSWENANARTVDTMIQADRITYDSLKELFYAYGDEGRQVLVASRRSPALSFGRSGRRRLVQPQDRRVSGRRPQDHPVHRRQDRHPARAGEPERSGQGARSHSRHPGLPRAVTMSARASSGINMSQGRLSTRQRRMTRRRDRRKADPARRYRRSAQPKAGLGSDLSIHLARPDDVAAGAAGGRGAGRVAEVPALGGADGGQLVLASGRTWRTRGCRSRGRRRRRRRPASGRWWRRTGSAPPRRSGGSTPSRRPGRRGRPSSRTPSPCSTCLK